MLGADDPNNMDSKLTFITEIQNGQFELLSDPAKGIKQFTQQQIKEGKVKFIYEYDGKISTDWLLTHISFVNVNIKLKSLNFILLKKFS